MSHVNILNFELHSEVKIIETSQIFNIDSFLNTKLKLTKITNSVYYPMTQMLVVRSENSYSSILPPLFFMPELGLFKPEKILCTIVNEEELSDNILNYIAKVYLAKSTLSALNSIDLLYQDDGLISFLGNIFNISRQKVVSHKFLQYLYGKDNCPSNETLYPLKKAAGKVKPRQEVIKIWNAYAKSIGGIYYLKLISMINNDKKEQWEKKIKKRIDEKQNIEELYYNVTTAVGVVNKK